MNGVVALVRVNVCRTVVNEAPPIHEWRRETK